MSTVTLEICGRSYDVRCRDGEWEIVQGLEISDAIGERMKASERELADERDTVKDLLPS